MSVEAAGVSVNTGNRKLQDVNVSAPQLQAVLLVSSICISFMRLDVHPSM